MFSGSLPEHVTLPMPALSPTMTHGTLVSWEVQEGDAIAAGDSIAQVGTDKATIPFDATEDGFMAKILVAEGTEDVPVGTVCAVMVEDKDDVAAFADYTADADAGAGASDSADAAAKEDSAPPPPPAAPAADDTPKRAAATASGDRVFASPYARKLAREAGLDITRVAGTGPNSRVVAADVEEYLANPPVEEDTDTSFASDSAAAAAPSADAAAYARGEFQDIPHTAMRRVIAERLTEAKRTVPHYYLTADVDIGELMKLRAQLNQQLDTKLSVNDFIIKASALALRQVPAVNSSWLESGVRAYDYVDVSVAVAVEEGLITPIVKDADKLGLGSISSTVRDLAGRAKDRKLQPDEYQGGTFTVSNLGMFGVRQFAAIINPPQAAILAVGAAQKRVVPNPDVDAEVPYASATVFTATLSCDHRVVDGAVGAEWLAAFKGYLENPVTMML